ncbi:MAG: hypothetical protein JW888_06685, partial [Pirellulales bacterium]|nr:hypothetical protein [Pirellulales bacterium]
KELECITSIEQSSPLLGGGKYLSVLVERKSDGSDACVGMTIDRHLALKDSVDLTKPYVVLFTVRIDSLSQFTEAGDRFSICTRNVPQSEFSFKKTASSGWHVCVVGKEGNDTRDAKSTNWTFLQREKNGKAVAVDSGINPREGTAYSFRILVDPQARMWTPSIAVDGGEWKEFRTMGMRSKGTAEKNHYWAFLHLYCQLEGGSRGADAEKVGFSVDSIRITPP